MASPRRGFQPHRGPRRKSSWTGGPNGTASLGATGHALIATGAQVTLEGSTLVRLRGRFSQQVSVIPAIGTNTMDAAFGVCIVSENAFGVGSTAVPNPVADDVWEGWLYHRYFLGGSGLSGAAIDNPCTFEVDSKAMRKLRATDVIIGVLGVTEVGAAGVLNVSFDSRLLLKLA